MSRASKSLILAMLLAAAVPAHAQGPAAFATRPDSALAQVVRELPGAPLPLSQAVASALEEASIVRDARAAMMAARGALKRERGAFDPSLFADAAKAGQDVANTNPFSSSTVVSDKTTSVNGGLSLRLPIGTELAAVLQTTRYETSSDFTLLDPQYSTTGSLVITQPLLKGFGPSAWADWKGAGRDYEAAQARYEDAVLATRAAVEQVYWDLYAGLRDYGVSKVLRDGAASLLQEAELRARTGLIGPNQVANARVFLAEREQLLLDSEEQLDAVSDRLATLIGRRPGDGLPRYLAVDEPPSDFALDPLDTLLVRAIASNQALRSAERSVEAARIRERGAKWDILPQLDFVGSIGGNGLAGTRQPVYFDTTAVYADPSLEGGFSDTWTSVTNRDLPTWSAGIRLTIPIGFREAAGEHQRLRGELERQQELYTAVRRNLEDQVRAAYRELQHAQRRVAAARDGADASLEQVRIGLLEFRAGRTTAFELVRLAGDVATAQQRYSAALVRAAKTAAELRRLTAGGNAAGTR